MRQFEITSNMVDIRHSFEAKTWRDAHDTFIDVAFEHQMGLRKTFPAEQIVRSQMDARRVHEIYFTVDNKEVERWYLREKDGGLRGWAHNLIASVS